MFYTGSCIAMFIAQEISLFSETGMFGRRDDAKGNEFLYSRA